MVVTDQRLVVVRLIETGDVEEVPAGYVWESAEQIADWSRDAVVGATFEPKGLLRRGRFRLSFSDGSECAVVGYPPAQARLVVAALQRDVASTERS